MYIHEAVRAVKGRLAEHATGRRKVGKLLKKGSKGDLVVRGVENYTRKILKRLQVAERFHLGDLTESGEAIGLLLKEEGGNSFSTKDVGGVLETYLDKLPYPTTWVDFNFNKTGAQGLLIHQEAPGSVSCVSFYDSKSFIGMRPEGPHTPWIVHDVVARLNLTPEGGLNLSASAGLFIGGIQEFLARNPGVDSNQHTHTQGLNTAIFLKIINCKNVTSHIVARTKSEIRRRRKKVVGSPLKDFKVLNFTMAHTVLRDDTAPEGYVYPTGETKRLHMCRGHIRTYTPERPHVCGFVGDMWIQPHIKGDKTKGRLDKRYELKQEVK